jgi:L-ascorbate metabolism protein UlaG (beta-lactamase superfamily)
LIGGEFMINYDVKISYLYNSGFIMETKNYVLIFDYYLDISAASVKSKSNGTIGEGDIRNNKKVFVFSSHSHEDHFNPVIFKWKSIRKDINYILSSDIQISEKDENIYYMGPYENLNIDDVRIKTYGSTDIGVSFHINVDGITVFHAGDLNWWHWWDEDKDYNEKAEKSFKEEIDRIKDTSSDIAFFPVDPRLKESYSLGGEYFIKKVSPKIFIPMHFGENYEITKLFAKYIERSNRSVKVMKLKYRGQEIKIKLNQ